MTQTVLRVFDCFLNEGSKILYRVALGFLKIIKPNLLRTLAAEQFTKMVTTLARETFDADTLMKVSTDSLTSSLSVCVCVCVRFKTNLWIVMV
jgi:hypothetical protein